MAKRLADSGIVWASFGARALRRFEIRVGLDALLRAHARTRGVRGRCFRTRDLATAMFRRILILCRDRQTYEARA